MKTNIFILILVLFFSFFSSMFSQVVINDEYFGNQWYLYMPGDENTRADIRVLDAWSRTMGNSNQKIADIEGDHGGANGYPLTSHDDLQGRITTQGQGFVGEHSTAVAGLLVANHNTIGIAGVNKFAHLRSYLYSNYDQWADKVRDARLDGNKIINISQGTPDDIFQVGNRLAEAYNSNIVSVVSVGNNSTSITNPAVYASVIAVGSSTKDNTSSFFSNYGPQIEFLAPGGSDFTQNNPKNIFTTSSNGDYVYTVGGTSYAAPLVSGAASLLLAYKPNLSNEDVKNILILSCDKLPEMNGANFTNKCGYGRINLKKAVQLLESPCVLDNNLTIAGGTDVGSGEMEQVVITDASGLSYDVYLVIEHEIRRTINFSTPNENVHVWGSGSASVGWSKERPLFGQNYCEVVPGSVTSSSAELKTYIYEVRTIDLTYLGYYPATANNVVFAYSVLSHPTQVNINLSVSQSPEGGPEGTYEVNGENVGASFNGTMYSSQTIEAIPPNTEWVFYQWSDGNTSNPRTLDASLDIYSVYKGTHISNDQNAYLNNSQSKFVQTPNGAQHIVYESMEDIWYEMSTDGGSTWQIMNDGKPLNTNIAKKPSMDYSGNYVAIVFQESNGGYYEIKLVTFYPDLDSYVLGQNTLVNFDFLDSYSSDANPVIGWSNSNRAIIVWSGAYAGPFGTESALIYKYCQITQTTFLILESGNVLNATEKSVNPTVFYNEYAYSTKNFHLAWEEQTTSSTSKIFYQRLYPDGSEEIQFADYYEASYGSGYSKNYNPAIVSNDFQNLGGRREDIRLSWIGYRDAQQEEELLKGNAASAGDTRVLHKHKLFSWSGLSVFGDNVGGMSQNHGDDIIGYYQAYGLA